MSFLVELHPNQIMPLVETEINLDVWADGGQIGRAQGATPVQIHLKPESADPHQRQYPLCQETREGLSKKRLNNRNSECPATAPVQSNS